MLPTLGALGTLSLKQHHFQRPVTTYITQRNTPVEKVLRNTITEKDACNVVNR